MLTLETLKKLPKNSIINYGSIENSPEGIYMTNDRVGDKLLWVAKRGEIHDWCIYIHWEEMGINFVLSNGDKVLNPKDIKRLVPCDDDAFKMYRN